MPVLVITQLVDPEVPPGDWDDPSYTTTSNDSDRFYYTGATETSRKWAAADGCRTLGSEAAFDTGYPQG